VVTHLLKSGGVKNVAHGWARQRACSFSGRVAELQQFGKQFGTNVIAENVWQVDLEVGQARRTHLVLYGGAFLLIASRH
jgi:hypothetical protein